MQQRDRVRALDAAITYTEVRSSRGKSWVGCDAYLYEGTRGRSELMMTHHSFCMHVGPSVLMRLQCDDQKIFRLFAEGDTKFMPQAHVRVLESMMPSSNIMVDLEPALIDQVSDELNLGIQASSLLPRLEIDDRRVEHVMFALLHELRTPYPMGRLYAESLCTSLAVWLLRNSLDEPHRVPLIGNRKLRAVLDHVEENLSRDLSLEQLAQIAGLSRSQFQITFKRSAGMTAHQYVLQRRVERAVHLITASPMPLAQIAFECGFANPSHLALAVRKFHGVAPAGMRREADAS